MINALALKRRLSLNPALTLAAINQIKMTRICRAIFIWFVFYYKLAKRYCYLSSKLYKRSR